MQSDYIQNKAEDLVEKSSAKNLVLDNLVLGEDSKVAKDEKPLSVSWLTGDEHAPKEHKMNKKIDSLSSQLKEAVNPFQRLKL